MGGKLAHAVCGGVKDQVSALQMALAIIAKHLSAGIGPVTQQPPPDLPGKLPAKFFRKAQWIGGKSLLR